MRRQQRFHRHAAPPGDGQRRRQDRFQDARPARGFPGGQGDDLHAIVGLARLDDADGQRLLARETGQDAPATRGKPVAEAGIERLAFVEDQVRQRTVRDRPARVQFAQHDRLGASAQPPQPVQRIRGRQHLRREPGLGREAVNPAVERDQDVGRTGVQGAEELQVRDAGFAAGGREQGAGIALGGRLQRVELDDGLEAREIDATAHDVRVAGGLEPRLALDAERHAECGALLRDGEERVGVNLRARTYAQVGIQQKARPAVDGRRPRTGRVGESKHDGWQYLAEWPRPPAHVNQ